MKKKPDWKLMIAVIMIVIIGAVLFRMTIYFPEKYKVLAANGSLFTAILVGISLLCLILWHVIKNKPPKDFIEAIFKKIHNYHFMPPFR